MVASIDQDFGTSMFFCSKTTLPSSPVMPAVRYSQAISSAGSTPAVVKKRRRVRPPRTAAFRSLACFRSFDAGDFSSRSMDSPQNNR